MIRPHLFQPLFLALILAMPSPAGAVVHEVIHHFTNPPQSPGPGNLVPGADGSYWGTTESGGTFSCGTVYRVNVATGEITTVIEFSDNGATNQGNDPKAALTDDGQGSFWGTTFQGGANDNGTIFKINTTTGTLTTLVSFTGNGASNKGSNPMGALVPDGAGHFWGITQDGGTGSNGTVFKIDATSGALTTVVNFTGDGASNKGSAPGAGLVPDGNGLLWGTTSGGGSAGLGTVFKIDPATGILTTVAQFSSSSTGSNPQAALTADGSGNFWGTTQNGGTNSGGTVFKIDTTSGTLTTVCSLVFNGHPGAALTRDGAGQFWGTTQFGGSLDSGTLFRVNPVSGTATTVVEFNGTEDPFKGTTPLAGLTPDGAGNLLGTTTAGGTSDIGTIFKINTTSSLFTTISECHRDQGSNPYAGLTPDADGLLWGTTRDGGAEDAGSVFKIDPVTQQFIPQADLPYSSGANPYGSLTSDGAGYFWGTTQNGGDNGYGSVFKVDASTGELTSQFSFTNSFGSHIGAAPYAGLTADGNGYLWGVTNTGGTTGNGTLFKVRTSTGVFTSVLSFTNAGSSNKGAKPRGALTPDGLGFLWGTTYQGGDSNLGTVFKVNIGTGQLTTLLSFTANGTVNRGVYPQSKLVSDGAGYLWGTTSQGDVTTPGTIFKVNVATGVLTTVVEFTGSGGSYHGANPIAGLTADGAGNFWGVTSAGGATDNGTVFKVNAASGAFASILDFTGNGTQAGSGSAPDGPLFLASDGRFYGTTSAGGSSGLGTIFRISVPTPFQEWQVTHFGSTTSPDAAADADPDGDGTTNETEFLLGLDPKDSTSRFRATCSGGPGGITLTWPGATGITFEIQRSTTLLDDWNTLTTVVGVGTYTDPAPPAGKAFYRVVLKP